MMSLNIKAFYNAPCKNPSWWLDLVGVLRASLFAAVALFLFPCAADNKHDDSDSRQLHAEPFRVVLRRNQR